MAGTSTTMNGLGKRVFGELVKTLPDFAILQREFPFDSKAQTGEEYEEEIVLSRSQGVTFNKTNRRGVATLNAVRTMQTAPARTTPSEIIMREQIAYGMMSSAERAGERAYEGALPLLMASIYESHRFYIELGMLYGASPTGIGVFESIAAGTTTRVVTITSASWATGIWSQMEGAAIDAYDVTGVTKRNTNALMAVSLVDPSARTITLTGNATDLGNLVATDFFVPVLGKGEMMDGIDKQLTNTGSLYGIDAGVYTMWRPNQVSAVGAPPTLDILFRALKAPVGRGLIAKQMLALVNEAFFTDIASDATTLRTFVENQKAGVEQGTHELIVNGSNNNVLRIMSHPMVKQGDGFIINKKDWVRGGDTDITNGLPKDGSRSGEQMFFNLQDVTALEFREFSSQFFFGRRPSHQTKITNVAARSAV